MRRFSTLIWMLVIVGAAFMLYMVKYQVQSLRQQVADTSHQLEAEKEALHVVAAEWAYLNRPERLQALANQYLSSTSVTADQVAEIEALPDQKQTLASNNSEDGVRPIPAKFTKSVGAAR
jgi:hypothetical protein